MAGHWWENRRVSRWHGAFVLAIGLLPILGAVWLIRSRYPSLEPFLKSPAPYILASINALITSSQAHYVIRLDNFVRIGNRELRYVVQFTFMLSAFFTLTAATLLTVLRIILWNAIGVTISNIYLDNAAADLAIVTATGWGYFLLAIIAWIAWLTRSALSASLDKDGWEKEIPRGNMEVPELDAKLSASKYYPLLGMRNVSLQRNGQAAVAVSVVPARHYHLYDAVHGGVILSLADAAAGAAVLASGIFAEGKKIVTNSLSLYFTAPVEDGVVTAAATTKKNKGDIRTVDIDVKDGKGMRIAHGTAAFSVLHPDK